MNKIIKYTLITCVLLTSIILFNNKPVLAAEASELNNNWIYIISNRSSRKCLNVNFGKDENGTNVTQYTQDGSLEQKFKLVYNSSSGAYKLYPMCSSGGNDRVLDVLRTGGSSSGNIQSGNNVDIWKANDSEAQEFVIKAIGTDLESDNPNNWHTYYSITLKSNPKLALTAYGYGNGSGAGTNSTSEGNVYVSNYTANSNQLWFFETMTVYSSAELMSWDLVDSGKHLDWGGTTKYLTQFETAVNTWNNHKNGVIRKDSLTTVKDVTISDKDLGKNDTLAETDPNGAIRFNIPLMDKAGNNKKINVCLHEIGHALGLSHRGGRATIMQDVATNLIGLSQAEKISYDYAYNNKY